MLTCILVLAIYLMLLSAPKETFVTIPKFSDFLARIQNRTFPGPTYGLKEVCYGELGCWRLKEGCMAHVPLLPRPPEFIDTTFYVVRREAPREVAVRALYEMDTQMVPEGATVAFVVHGWLMHAHHDLMLQLRDGARRHYDVIVNVDWWRGAALNGYYFQSAVDGVLVAHQMALFVEKLVKERRVAPADIDMYGFSFGAHMIGFAGDRVQKKYGFKLGRLFGLDPARIPFEGTDCHLKRSDANWVGVVHTSAGNSVLAGEWGYHGEIGHIDWFPNGGVRQTGCGDVIFDLICSHYRSCELVAASLVGRCQMTSYECRDWPTFRRGQCQNDHVTQNVSHVTKSNSHVTPNGSHVTQNGSHVTQNHSPMTPFGYFASPDARGRHYFKTTDRHPFCEGVPPEGSWLGSRLEDVHWMLGDLAYPLLKSIDLFT